MAGRPRRRDSARVSPEMIPPEARLDRVEFDPRAELQGRIEIGVYTCSHCREQVGFKTTDFLRRFRKPRSNLDGSDQAVFNAFRPPHPAREESFLDFYCAGCGRAVRVIYEGWEFAMGSYAFIVTSIVESA
ncbi:MAG: hypothetical protein HY646_22505 [Acidobacteria bacterium]|nr:hypothetical protein [Acidobacteriota bacterium]